MSRLLFSRFLRPPPSPTPTESPIAELSLLLADPPQLQTIVPVRTPDHSAPALAPSAISSPPTPTAPAPSTTLAPTTTSGPSPAPPSAAPADSSPTLTLLTISEWPPPSPWPEGYVFSTDPDRIICRYCCKRHNNYKWYSHCYLCHTNESKP
jgi:hypothetical protein